MYGEMGFVFMRRDGVSLLCYGSAGDLIGAAMPQKDITTLLVDWRNGDQDALSELTPLVYSRLRQLAAAQLRREKPGHTLQSTALVHEAYLKLIDQTRVQWHDRNHFFAIAAQIIRRVLVNHARKRGSSKRGGGRTLLSLNESVAAQNAEDVDLLALDDALDNLARLDPQQARIIELRFFAGLTIEETAEVMGISTSTVNRDWTLARAWLKRALTTAPGRDAAHGT